jgi:NADPH2:quinone reductase
MQAVRFHETGGPEVLRLEDIAEPSLGPDELLIDVEATGVNFIDTYFRQGWYPTTLPSTLGSEGAGVVRSIGANVSGFRVGDRVVSQSVRGSYAERAAVPAASAVVIPGNISSKTAAALWLQGITAHYLSTSLFPLAPGHRALVHAAAGGVGLLLCQMAKRRGAFVIGTASTPEKRTLAHDAGADEMIDYTTQDFAAETRRITGGAGVHVVYDSVGQSTFDKSLDCLVPRGMMALFGQSSGRVPDPQPEGIAVLHTSDGRALHRDARRAGAAREGPVRLGHRRSAARARRSGIPVGARRRRASGAGRAADDGQGIAFARLRGRAKPSGARRGTCA